MWAHILNLLNIPICDTTVHMALGWSLVLHSCQLRSHINHLAQTQQTQLSDRQLSYLIRHDKLTRKAGDVFNSIFWNRISGEAGIASKFSSRKLKWTLARVSAQVNDAIALICESHHVHCQLVGHTAPHPHLQFLIPTCTCLTRGMIAPVGQSWSWCYWWHQYYWSNRSARWSLARRSCQLCIFVFKLRVEAELVLLGLKRDTNCSSEAADSCRGELTI